MDNRGVRRHRLRKMLLLQSCYTFSNTGDAANRGREKKKFTMRHSVSEQTQRPKFQRSGWRARARPSSTQVALGWQVAPLQHA